MRRRVTGLALGCQVFAVYALAVAVQAAEPYSRGASPYGSTGRAAAPATRTNTQSSGVGSSAYGQPRQLAPQTQARPMNPAAAPGYPTTKSRTAAAPAPATRSSAAASRTPPSGASSGASRGAAGEGSQPANVPSPDQALRLTPIQNDVEFTRPAEGDVARCKVTAVRSEGAVGWIVEDPAGLPLRRFLDTNGDNKVDQWSYFKDGLEVYRDIDADFNGKADQYRWFSTAGSRWALDRDEDGLIDAWQSISAEEVTAEVVAALAKQDAARFARVAMTAEDLRALGLGPAKSQDLGERIAALGIKFKDAAAHSKGVNEKTRWVHFSGSQPGILPVGTEGSTKDLQVYENVVAIAQTGTEHAQVQIGTLVKVGSGWKVIDAPQVIAEGESKQADAGYFFRVAPSNRPQIAADAPNEKTQEILTALQKLDAAAAQAASPEEQARVHAQRADLLVKMADEAGKPEDRAMWLRQLADMLGAAAQSGSFPEGVKRLDTLFERVRRNEQDRDLAAHVRFVALTAQYGLSMQAKGADFAKIQTEWLKALEQYVAEYPKSADSAEAMLQLGIAQEFAGREDDAKRWYGQIIADFSGSPTARKAAGAKTRLESVGKVLALQGKSPAGATVDLAKYRGQVVLIQYWAAWCEPCKADMATLKELVGKHGRSFAVIGVNLDNDEAAMTSFLKENPLPWSQIFEPGGLESRPAIEMGILTLPTMMLVDQEGRVVNRNITSVELETEVKRLIK